MLRVRALIGIVAACLSIGGSIYGYLRVIRRAHSTGELVTQVRDRADRPVLNASVEVLTPTDSVVTKFIAAEPTGGRRSLKEGTYRVRVSHPKYAPEIRTVEIVGGQTSQVRFRLGPRARNLERLKEIGR
jgi:hypothetical protein